MIEDEANELVIAVESERELEVVARVRDPIEAGEEVFVVGHRMRARAP